MEVILKNWFKAHSNLFHFLVSLVMHWALAQAAETVCGVSILWDTQNPSRHKWPCLGRKRLDQMSYRDPVQPQLFCDFVKKHLFTVGKKFNYNFINSSNMGKPWALAHSLISGHSFLSLVILAKYHHALGEKKSWWFKCNNLSFYF